MRLFYALWPLCAVVTSLSLSAASLSVTSPDGNIELTLDDSNLSYQVQFHGQPVNALARRYTATAPTPTGAPNPTR